MKELWIVIGYDIDGDQFFVSHNCRADAEKEAERLVPLTSDEVTVARVYTRYTVKTQKEELA